METISILVIDDEPDNFDVIDSIYRINKSWFSENKPLNLCYSSSGQEAIDSLGAINPDLILLDVMMPVMDGIETCKKIKSTNDWKSIPIIILTALSTKEDLARCLEAGADDFVSKPINSVELMARTKSMLRIKWQFDEIKQYADIQKDAISVLNKSLQELKGNVEIGLSFDVKAPLTNLMGSLYILRSDYKKLKSERIHELVNLAYQSSLNLERLTCKFLTYLQIKSTDLSALECTSKLTKPRLNYIGNAIATKFSRPTDIEIIFEEKNNLVIGINQKHFQLLLEELLDNAFRFSSSGQPVTVLCSFADRKLDLWIIDRGKGIAVLQNDGLQEEDSLACIKQLSGFGLKIAISIIELYGGNIKISSMKDNGTKMHLQLSTQATKNIPDYSD
ncbi:hybrid sensor histidine kinase/response regulator [Synechococcus sp. PCC 7336]|uniref:hybrid sensor histidine kinase/response regulator n=1 Tax=Synechococcus sp. PCC 7336 TaxID=195250 RepID=UPI000344DC92|nr:hybrid sensor histidine kinase/response regulator [Synechococcus sp. PCC 7336]